LLVLGRLRDGSTEGMLGGGAPSRLAQKLYPPERNQHRAA